MNWKNFPGGNFFKINKKPKHSGCLQTLKCPNWIRHLFYKIALKAPKQILMRIPSFIYVVPNLMMGNHFIYSLLIYPPEVFILLSVYKGFEAECIKTLVSIEFKTRGFEFHIAHVVHNLSDVALATWLGETPDDWLISSG